MNPQKFIIILAAVILLRCATVRAQSGSGSFSFGQGVTPAGNFSMAGGSNSTALGTASVALGLSSTASGVGSIAAGINNTASGYYSVVLGEGNTAIGNGAVAFGTSNHADYWLSTVLGGAFNTSSGNYGIVAGGLSTASTYSVAIGENVQAFNSSTAFGWNTTSIGRYSTAMGYGTYATGYYSTASGYYTTASAAYSFTVGRFNVGGGSALSWTGSDPLFEVGNGASTSATSDALVVYQNGNTVVSGTLAVSGSNPILVYQAGDISMGSFQAGPKPPSQ